MANLKPRKRGRGAVQNVQTRTEEHTVPHNSPGNLVELPLDALRRYRLRYSLPIATPTTFPGFLLGGSVGKLSNSHVKYRRSSYPAASRAVMNHLHDGIIKEGDAIAEFLYTVQHKDEVFKLRFGRDERAVLDAGAPTEADPGPEKPNSHEPDTMDTGPTSTDANAPQESHIPLPVEPLSARPTNTAELTPLTAHG